MKFAKIFLSMIFVILVAGCENKSKTIEQSDSTITFDKPREERYFGDYVGLLKNYAKSQGINSQTINVAFDKVYYIEHVVNADKNQPEKKSSINDYLSRTVSQERIKLAKQKFIQYHSQLSEATLLTHVPQNYILALWGVESGYGKYQGKEDIISALSTLAFDGRREQFFLKELMAALRILENGHIKKTEFKGSWAGAMGQNQFMPSSYLAYGLDGDGDGKVDIWKNMSDIFASTGNYLATVGWKEKESWGFKVNLPENLELNLVGLDNDKVKLVADWLKLGIKQSDNKMIIDTQTKAWLIIPDEGSREGYLVFNNFKTLMHWNRSYHFAISVGMLADSLVDNTINIHAGK